MHQPCHLHHKMCHETQPHVHRILVLRTREVDVHLCTRTLSCWIDASHERTRSSTIPCRSFHVDPFTSKKLSSCRVATAPRERVAESVPFDGL